MDNQEIGNIKKDIEKSGLPCEVETTLKLSSSNWIVTNQSAYIDEDTKDLRHIDLTAYKHLKQTSINIILIIECSKSDKPWAFYGKEKETAMLSICPSYYPKAEPKGDSLLAIICSHQGKKGIFEGYIPYEPFTKGKSINVFDAAMKVVKALEYEMAKQEEWSKRLGLNDVGIFYPVIVFDGHLYSLIVENEKIVPVRKEYLTYQFEYKERYYMIDVVAESGLVEFIENLNKEFRRIRQRQRKLSGIRKQNSSAKPSS